LLKFAVFYDHGHVLFIERFRDDACKIRCHLCRLHVSAFIVLATFVSLSLGFS